MSLVLGTTLDSQDPRVFPGPDVSVSSRTAYNSDHPAREPCPTQLGSGENPGCERSIGRTEAKRSLATPTSCPIPGLSRSPLPVNRMLRQFPPSLAQLPPGSLARPQAPTRARAGGFWRLVWQV